MKPAGPALIVILTALYSVNATASDFAALGVIVGGGGIAITNIALGFWACVVAKTKGHTKALPILGIMGFLIFAGVGLINGEADHMTDGDTTGMIHVVVWPGIIAILAPFFVTKK